MGWLIRAVDLYKSFTMPDVKNTLDNLPPSKIWSLVHDMLRFEFCFQTLLLCQNYKILLQCNQGSKGIRKRPIS